MRLILILLLLAAAVLFLGRVDWSNLPASISLNLPGASEPTPVPRSPAGPAPASAKPRPGDVTVEITEAELNGRLGQQFVGRSLGQTPLGPATLERTQVALRSGRAEVTGSARVGGASLPFTSFLTATPDGSGGVRVAVTEASVRSIPLPQSARDQLESVMQAEIDRQLSGQRIRVTSVEIADGRLRASGGRAG